jgi:hypothetical protein
MLIQEWTNMFNELQGYLLLKTIQFMRWINLSEENWIWLDQNIFNGAL